MDQFGVRKLSLFGSVARNEAHDASDLDLLVEFDDSSTLDGYFGVLFLIEDELGVNVDLAEPSTLHPLIRDQVLREAVTVA
ncbi:nucleotidyltransferase [soil metagenome]